MPFFPSKLDASSSTTLTMGYDIVDLLVLGCRPLVLVRHLGCALGFDRIAKVVERIGGFFRSAGSAYSRSWWF